MPEVNLLDTYPRVKRPIAEREREVPRQREIAKRFGREYFDGDRSQGYGGYRYDGRWVAVARRMIERYDLTTTSRILDIGCAKGFLLHDFRTLLPGVLVAGLEISRYAIENSMETVRPFLVQGSADDVTFADGSFDLVISINTAHNLPLERCRRAIEEMERVSRRHKYIQVDSYRNDQERENFQRWQLTALTHFEPDRWRTIFQECGYSGDYFWTITE